MELVIAFAVLGLVLTAVVLGLNVGIQAGERVDRQTIATQLARSQIEYILSQPYALSYPIIPTPEGWDIKLTVRENIPTLLQEIEVKTFFEDKEVLSLSVYKANSPR